MTDRSFSERDEHGLSARQLVLLFLGIVTVCGVFFAAGFLVGYNERTSKGLPQAEQVTPSGDIPPTVNPPAKSAEKASSPPASESASQAPPIEPTPATSEPVRTAPEPEKKKPARPANPQPPENGRFVLQVAASSSRPDAEAVARALKSKGLPAFVVQPQTGGGDKLYRVQIGPYSSREAAEAMKPRLEQEGFKSPFIKH
ncbi:MAG: SPOR domain-containing protein [Deltaproteobacteria bacterium]